MENPGFQFYNVVFSTDAMYTIVRLCEPLMVSTCLYGIYKFGLVCKTVSKIVEDPKLSKKH